MTTTRTILVAEDDPRLLKALALRLQAAGYAVITVQDGYQALDRCRRELPDLLLIDINMPGGDGLSVHERKQKLDDIAHIPVVYITGDSREDAIARAHALGAVAVIPKPIDPRELLAVVDAATRRAA